MDRRQFEHVLRASGSLTGCRELIVIGSQALLASHPDAPAELTRSMEVDLYPSEAPELADLIDGSIGELSPFHETFGYYGHGVGPETAILPPDWRQRAITLEGPELGDVIAICLAPIDLALSKLAAGRPKDLEFVAALARHRIVDRSAIESLAAKLPEPSRSLVRQRV